MSEITSSLVARLRRETGIGIMECQKVLEQAGGDIEKAKNILREKGAQKAAKRAERVASQGVVASYVHANKKIGTMVVLACETDFVAKNEEFIELAKELALQVAATSPKYTNKEQIPAEELEKEKEIYRAQLKDEKKPPQVLEKIIEGKLKKYYEEVCLLEQQYIKDETRLIKNLVGDLISKIGEKIEVVKFVRFEI